MSARKASLLSVGRADFVRDIRRGSMPGFDKVLQLLKVLGIEFRLGRQGSDVPEAIARSLGLPENAGLEEAVDRIERLTGEDDTLTRIVREIRAVRAAVSKMNDSPMRQAEVRELAAAGRYAGSWRTETPTRQVEVRELAAAAGGGAMELDERVVGYIAFQRAWLDRHALDPSQCTVISVNGDSMEPTLPDGSKILVDRTRRHPQNRRVYVVWTPEGLLVKRARKEKTGQWLLTSDNPSLKPITWPKEARVIGEVKWVGHTL